MLKKKKKNVMSQKIQWKPQFGEVESRSSPDDRLCTAVDGVAEKKRN